MQKRVCICLSPPAPVLGTELFLFLFAFSFLYYSSPSTYIHLSIYTYVHTPFSLTRHTHAPSFSFSFSSSRYHLFLSLLSGVPLVSIICCPLICHLFLGSHRPSSIRASGIGEGVASGLGLLYTGA